MLYRSGLSFLGAGKQATLDPEEAWVGYLLEVRRFYNRVV